MSDSPQKLPRNDSLSAPSRARLVHVTLPRGARRAFFGMSVEPPGESRDLSREDRFDPSEYGAMPTIDAFACNRLLNGERHSGEPGHEGDEPDDRGALRLNPPGRSPESAFRAGPDSPPWPDPRSACSGRHGRP